jgi:hypothetical protein
VVGKTEGDEDDTHFMFALCDGAHAVSVDGEVGPCVNALQIINQSCDPNCRMVECYMIRGRLLARLRVCDTGVWSPERNARTNYHFLSTEDPDDARLGIVRLCGNNPFDAGERSKFRGKLVQLFE